MTKAKENYIEHYFKQPGKLPGKVRGLVTSHFPKEEVVLYAYNDLTSDLKIQKSWLVLTEKHLVEVKEVNGKYRFEEFIQRELINEKVKEIYSPSCCEFKFEQKGSGELVFHIYFSHRQKHTMSAIKCALEAEVMVNAEEAYQDALLKDLNLSISKTGLKKKSTFFRLVSYLKPYKREVTIGAIGAVFATALGLLPALISGHLIDKVIKPFENGAMSADQAMKIGMMAVAALGLSLLFREVGVYFRLNRMSVVGEWVARDLRKKLYKHIQSLGIDYFSKMHTGSLISRLSSDTDRLWDFIAFGLVEVVIALLTLTGLSAILLFLDWRLGLVMVIPLPFLLGAIYFHGEKMQKLFLNCWRKWSAVTSVLSDTIPGIQVVKAFRQEKKEIKRYGKRNQEVVEEFEKVHQHWTRFWPFLMLGIHMIVIGIWFFGLPRLVGASGGNLSAGTFISFLLYMTMFAQPIEIIGQVARMLNRALSSAHRIFEVLDAKSTMVEKQNGVKPEILKGEVEFENVRFTYDGIRQILKGMNFKVQPGEMIGLVGPSGGGKSTLTKLIARFYDAKQGRILIDGLDLKDLDLTWYRRGIGMVLQEPYLFHGTIAGNISYGHDLATKEEIIEAAKVANAHEFICKLPFGYETIVGERGHSLSGGERQRVSIARAILHDPKILILDEATSAVDTETERKIQEALDRLIKGRTVFAVAHRLSTLRKADRIFVIKDGEIVEEGSHQTLLDKEGGEYQNLHQMQIELSSGESLGGKNEIRV